MRGRYPPAAGSAAHGRAEGEVVRRAPAVLLVVDVEVEVVHHEGALEVGELLERPVQRLLGQVVGDRHVRVVGEVEVGGERPAAYGGGELLARGDALDDG